MANILDYIDWRGDLNINDFKINVVDICAFTQLALIDLEGVVPSVCEDESISIQDAYTKLSIKHGNQVNDLGLIIPNNMVPMLGKMAKSVRFKDIRLYNYIEKIRIEEELQFCALCASINAEYEAIIFSGTDDTIIGWKENLNMLSSRQSGRNEALRYLKTVMTKDKKYIICGHSKGGYLALYSVINAEEAQQRKIVSGYSFDGPGMMEDVRKIPGFNKKIAKFTQVNPQTSIVGKMFNHYSKQMIVKSNVSGLYQHDVFTWEVLGTEFVCEKEYTKDAVYIDGKIKSLVLNMDEKTKDIFVEVMYQLLGESNIRTLTELNQKRSSMLKQFFKIDINAKREFNKIIVDVVSDPIVLKNLATYIAGMPKFNKYKKDVKKNG